MQTGQVTVNGRVYDYRYDRATVMLDGSDLVVVDVVYQDPFGQDQSRNICLEFSGSSANEIRSTIISAIESRIDSKYGD